MSAKRNVRHKIIYVRKKGRGICPHKICPQKQMSATRYVRQKLKHTSATRYVCKKIQKNMSAISCGKHFILRICGADSACGGHYFLRTYVVADLSVWVFCGDTLWWKLLYLTDTTRQGYILTNLINCQTFLNGFYCIFPRRFQICQIPFEILHYLIS